MLNGKISDNYPIFCRFYSISDLQMNILGVSGLTSHYWTITINAPMQHDSDYTIPLKTQIGHVHLKVSDLEKAMDFYCKLLGFEITTMYGDEAAFISAGGYHHHIGLNVWFSKGGEAAPRDATGLFHTAIRYPERKDLARILQRLRNAGYPLTGASDHGVSEALYLDDPDKNGVELYWDRPERDWPRKEDGSIHMYTRPLDLENLRSELDD